LLKELEFQPFLEFSRLELIKTPGIMEDVMKLRYKEHENRRKQKIMNVKLGMNQID